MLSLSIAYILRRIITANLEPIMIDGKVIKSTDAIKTIHIFNYNSQLIN